MLIMLMCYYAYDYAWYAYYAYLGVPDHVFSCFFG